MDLQRKAIHTLTVSLDEKREELSSFYRQFGEKLLKDSADPVILAGALSPDRIETWQTLMTTRETDAQSVLEIKAALSRQQELVQFKKELDRVLAQENKRYRERLEALGRAFYAQYSEKDAPVFGDVYERASSEGNTLAHLEEKQGRLRQELEDAGFFGKIFMQFKVASLSSHIRQHKNKVLSILSEGAESLVTGGVIEQLLADGELEDSFGDIFGEIQEIIAKREDIRSRAKTIESDHTVVRDTLESLAASDNPQRRMDELRYRIRDADKRIDTLTILSAREYSDKFLDEDGASVLGGSLDGHSFSDMGAYSYQLEQVSRLRLDVSVVRRKIEVLETSLKIDSLERNIATWEKSVQDYERKIQHYQGLIDTTRKSIDEAHAERIRLGEHKESVEKTL